MKALHGIVDYHWLGFGSSHLGPTDKRYSSLHFSMVRCEAIHLAGVLKNARSGVSRYGEDVQLSPLWTNLSRGVNHCFTWSGMPFLCLRSLA